MHATLIHQTKKGQQWRFGMKAHIGVDNDSGLVPAHVRDRGLNVKHQPRHQRYCTGKESDVTRPTRSYVGGMEEARGAGHNEQRKIRLAHVSVKRKENIEVNDG
jgi:hypothetical protein